MTHQPTFKPTPQRRAWHRRLTPVAWVLIAVVVLAALAGLGAGGYALTQGRERPFTLPPTPTPDPTAEPAATAGPVTTPTVWWERMITPTATAEVAFPAWWSDRMTQDADGEWWPPEEVVEQVGEDYQSAENEYTALVEANDLDSIVENLPRWFAGNSLVWQTTGFGEIQAGNQSLGYIRWGIELPPQVQDFSADGLQCTLGRSVQDGTHYQWTDEELVAAEAVPGGLYLIRMQYDPSDGRWKNSNILEVIPVSAEQ